MISIDKKKKKQAAPAEEPKNVTEEIPMEETAAPAEEATAEQVSEASAAEENMQESAVLLSSEELAILNDKYLRICAEYDNYRKRTQKEKNELYSDVKANVVTAFLPVYDNLERALSQTTADEAYAKGVEMIMNQFKSTLEKLGVEEIPALGEKFDPNLHNAVMHEDNEEKGENEIVQVFQKGFRCGDKIIRFAMVKVAN